MNWLNIVAGFGVGVMVGVTGVGGGSLMTPILGGFAILAFIYIVLGTALDGVSMIVLTTSVVIPMVEKAGFDLIWFSIFIVLLVEIAELTPPLGFNIFVLQTMTGRDSNYVAWASLPFFFMMVLCVVLITLFPQLCTWLPDVLIGVAKK